MGGIKSISEFITEVEKVSKEYGDDTIITFRGETLYYDTFCQPNIFRNDHLKCNPYFERNLFDEMKANNLTKGETYIEQAIDAQHGGFPSRLLDVTYNSLIALYFATTPHPRYEVTSTDEDNGYVYVYFIKKLFCPSGSCINEVYNSIVERKAPWLNECSIFQKNHKLIDHIKANKRIIAQQGALILFQGDQPSAIPECMFNRIDIDKSAKKKIREDLKRYFGIHNGTIYPEIDNFVQEITWKSSLINSLNFSYKEELNLVITNLCEELDYYENEVIELIEKLNNESEKNYNSFRYVIDKIIEIERVIYSYRLGLNEIKSINDVISTSEIEKVRNEYNRLINEFYNFIKIHISDINGYPEIEFSLKELII